MIHIQAKMSLKPEAKAEFLKEIKLLMNASKKEAGNHQYELVAVVGEENEFKMLETWEDQAAIEAHNQSEHFKTFQQQAASWLAAPLSITLLTELKPN
ncbi:hypothetical protein CKN82_05365 [Carnobacterium divergens]|uniref:putative quinol monooxygenase n=1 Tax=Carnobacterium divergens TaxID=2748 RepID=UPI000E76C72C|nr:putative quinol monooxygenase [Carnobacterium divergens]AOA00583.1 hypothetical protein BFC22_10985 [Carnobacterium divergens]MDT1997295.1 antibiotic biosynthesis monooxygenase [Carnobacterium divergens]TFI66024.1 hypothetical protein CKN76_05810 [Carnobacterium divergens]TFI66083.1 hypothetical protein CKN59_05795 [Carnobacterium divergens]TFI69730.1 hypothetical protein CKN70_05415 [Carnobacterium divergens]